MMMMMMMMMMMRIVWSWSRPSYGLVSL